MLASPYIFITAWSLSATSRATPERSHKPIRLLLAHTMPPAMSSGACILWLAACSCSIMHRVAAKPSPLRTKTRQIALLSHAPTPTFAVVQKALCQTAGSQCINASTSPLHMLQHQLKHATFDIMLAERHDSAAIADFAEWSGTPVIRVAANLADVHAAFERPALIVVPETCRPCSPGRYTPSVRHYVVGDETQALTQTIEDAAATNNQPSFTCKPRTLSFDDAVNADSAPLGLAMIVRNEGRFIVPTLDSALGSIDAWTVLDSGSNDDTLKKIKSSKLAQTVPGTVDERPFVDFATTRNVALQRHGVKTAYTYMADAEFWTRGLWRLRTIALRLETECQLWSRHLCAAALQVALRTTGIEFFKTLVYPSFGKVEGTRECVARGCGQGRQKMVAQPTFPHPPLTSRWIPSCLALPLPHPRAAWIWAGTRRRDNHSAFLRPHGAIAWR